MQDPIADSSAAPSPLCFISYARANLDADLRLVLRELERALSPEVMVFRDAVHVRLGRDFERVLGDALREASVMLCFYSPQYFRSRWCAQELSWFIERCKRAGVPPRIVPVYWTACSPPRALRRFQFDTEQLGIGATGLRATAALGEHNVQLAAVVAQLAKEVAAHASPPLPPDAPTESPFSTKSAWVPWLQHSPSLLVLPALISAGGYGAWRWWPQEEKRSTPTESPTASPSESTMPIPATRTVKNCTPWPVTIDVANAARPLASGESADVPEEAATAKVDGVADKLTLPAGKADLWGVSTRVGDSETRDHLLLRGTDGVLAVSPSAVGEARGIDVSLRAATPCGRARIRAVLSEGHVESAQDLKLRLCDASAVARALGTSWTVAGATLSKWTQPQRVWLPKQSSGWSVFRVEEDRRGCRVVRGGTTPLPDPSETPPTDPSVTPVPTTCTSSCCMTVSGAVKSMGSACGASYQVAYTSLSAAEQLKLPHCANRSVQRCAQ